MNTVLYATFDGEVLRPERPVRLPPNTRLRVVIETVEDETNTTSFLDSAEALNLDGTVDGEARAITESGDILIGEEALRLAKKLGFVGCLEAEPEFSDRYKEHLDWSDKT